MYAAGRQALLEVMQRDIGSRRLDVHRYLDVHGARPAREHRAERAMEHERKLGHGIDRPLALGHRLDDPREVVVSMALEFLHRAVALHVQWRRARDRDQRRRVGVGGSQPHDRVGGARADGCQGGDRFGARTVVAVGEMGRALLVEDLKDLDVRLIAEEAVEQRPDAVPGDTRCVLDSVVRECASDDLATGQTGHPLSRPSSS